MKKKERSEFIFEYLDEHKNKLTKETNYFSKELLSYEEDKEYSDISSTQLNKFFNDGHKEDDSADLKVSEIPKIWLMT